MGGKPASVTGLAKRLILRLTSEVWKENPFGDQESPVTRAEIRLILGRAKAIIQEQPAMIELTGPVHIFGDLHGQLADLLRWMRDSRVAPRPKFLFLGDYVDRGPRSVDLIVLLLSYKVVYPEEFFLLRGNHETRLVSRNYGFLEECQERFDEDLWQDFHTVFDWLPLSARVNRRILCLHGGLSPLLRTVQQLAAIPRPEQCNFEVGYQPNLVKDILWSDPNPDPYAPPWVPNVDRRASQMFSAAVVTEFCRNNRLSLIIRAHHMAEPHGYETFADNHMLTIFSAPNYGDMGNTAAMAMVDANSVLTIKLLEPKTNN